MEIQNRRALKDAAGCSLAQASDSPKKLLLLHLGVTFILSLLLSIVDSLLEQQIGAAGGLSGLGSRSLMTTVRMLLRLSQTVLLPFWQMGYLFLTLKLCRGEAVNPQTLLEGFRKFGLVLRYHLIVGVLFLGIVLASSYLSGMLFLLSPFSGPLMEEFEQLLSNSQIAEDAGALELATMELAMKYATPILIVFGIVFLILFIPLFCRYRMAGFVLLDTPETGAIHALKTSGKMMRHHWLDVFKLDLSFWWFYLLEALVAAVSYGDALLSLAGVSLPISPNVLYFLFLIAGMLCQLALYWWRKNEVSVTYAHAYAVLHSAIPESPAPQPKNPPWGV